MAKEKGLSQEIITKLNQNVATVIADTELGGFDKAYKIASAISILKELLTSEYMAPIMAMQGNKLGFKTDRDINQDGSKGQGYPEAIVKDCLIEAVLMGVQPYGNQFNIIASNCYLTKEGLGFMLSKWPGLWYRIVNGLPRINTESTSAAIEMKITWTLNGGVLQTEKLDIPVKMNKRMGVDAVIGKATRKARAWLYSSLSGSEVPEGDITDSGISAAELKPLDVAKDKEAERVAHMIEDATDITELEKLQPHLKNDDLLDKWNAKHIFITNKTKG